MGLGLAGQPADPVQPGLGRSRTASRGAERKALVWWDAEAGRWNRARRGRLRRRPAAVLPGRRTTLPASTPSPAWTRSSCRPTARAGCSPRPAWWTARCRRTTSRRSPRSPNPLYGQQRKPGPGDPQAPAEPVPAVRPRARLRRVSPTSPPPYRLTEHHTAGGMFAHAALPVRAATGVLSVRSRRCLAAERGPGGTAAGPRSSRRGARSRPGCWSPSGSGPIEVQGRRLHQIGLPYHWGANGLSTGDSANDLAHLALEPETCTSRRLKALACDIRPRSPAAAGPRCGTWCASTCNGAGITDDTGTEV